MRIVVPLVLLAMLAGCLRDPAPEASRESLIAANAAYDRALVDGDAAALEALYTDDYMIIGDSAEVVGKADQIRTLTEQVDFVSARTDEIKVTPLGAGAALLTARFTGRYRAEGQEQEFVERYTSIWVRRGSQWKLRHEHASMIPPQGAAEVQPTAT